MRKMYGFIALVMLLCPANVAVADVSIGIGAPNVSIGINLPLFPELVPVPGYPVYYAPRVATNYFFYDGMYWVYQDDNWYASSWYNGPWAYVDPFYVPLYILRIPVSYYRHPPPYFRGWARNAPPRWGQHWGRSWEQRRSGWDHWKRGSAPRPAPLPLYQRRYSGDRYPRAEQQPVIRSQNYRYQPRDRAVRQHFQQSEQRAPAVRRGGPERPQPPQRGGEHLQRSAPPQAVPQQRGPAEHEQRRPQAPAAHEPRQQAPMRQMQPAAPQREQRAPQGHEPQRGNEPRGGGQEQERGHGEGRGR